MRPGQAVCQQERPQPSRLEKELIIDGKTQHDSTTDNGNGEKAGETVKAWPVVLLRWLKRSKQLAIVALIGFAK